jgi:hypothetical protein
MATITKDTDQLPNVNDAGFSTAWDWKSEAVSKLTDDGYERFSQLSASPDTTCLFAGPARFTGLNGNAQDLTPIGLTDGISMSTSPSLARLFEIGSNRSFFTRGKTAHSVSLSKMLADQQNILAALTAVSYRGLYTTSSSAGSTSPTSNIMMNLDSEYFSAPFGLMLVFKTRGGNQDTNGKVLTALYLEYCMFSNYGFSVASTSPVISEGVGIEFDRIVPVDFA